MCTHCLHTGRNQLKREALAHLEARNKTEKTAKWMILAGGIFLLVRDHLTRITHLTIDLEFDERTMKQLRNWLYQKIRLEWRREGTHPRFRRDDIRLDSIGKKHRAHELAYGIYTDQIQPEEDIRIKRRDLLTLF